MKKVKAIPSKRKAAIAQKEMSIAVKDHIKSGPSRSRIEVLAPHLKKIEVKPEKLILDPNNPRFMTRDNDRVDEADYIDMEIGGVTHKKIYPAKDKYKIQELVNSIKQNHWWPVDFIFVRKLKGDDRYLVLEGNRRIAAIRAIKNDPTADPGLKKSLGTIEVMQVLDAGSGEDLKRKITYLLGVRHHGSLVKWTPFAQAHNIYKRYLEESSQNPDGFQWSSVHGKAVAGTLSITEEDVCNRLKVYRAMEQLGNFPEIRDSSGGMKDRYYSVCEEPLKSSGPLGNYIAQDQQTFLLTNESLVRMNTVCHFSTKERADAPIHNPQEWRYLEKILADESEEERAQNLREVEVNKSHPSDVWAETAAKRSPETWERWLFHVNTILKTVSFGDDLDSPEAKKTVQRLIALIETLDQRDVA